MMMDDDDSDDEWVSVLQLMEASSCIHTKVTRFSWTRSNFDLHEQNIEVFWYSAVLW